MELRVEYLEPYYDSVLMLGDSPEMLEALDALIAAATLRPRASPSIEETRMRVFRVDPGPGLIPLRLFYWLEDDTVWIMHVEPDDDWDS